MLLPALILALAATLIVMVVRRRWIGRLTSLATLLAAAILVLVLARAGLLPGSTGPLENERVQVPTLDR